MRVQGLAVLAASVLFCSAAHAAEPTFQFLPEPDFQTIVVKAVQQSQPKDAFAGLAECTVVDAQTFVRVPAPQALKMLAPCFKAVGARYGQPVRLEPMADPSQESLSIQVEGLAVYVPEELGVMSPLMRDLQHALSTRHDRILGQPVVIRREPLPSANKPALDPNALTISALQHTIDNCYTAQVVRAITTSEEFISSYGRCIVSDSNLQVRDIRPARPLGVLLRSDADATVVRTMNGQVRVFGGNGPVLISVTAYPSVVTQ